MGWGAVEKRRGTCDWQETDRMIDYLLGNGVTIRSFAA